MKNKSWRKGCWSASGAMFMIIMLSGGASANVEKYTIRMKALSPVQANSPEDEPWVAFAKENNLNYKDDWSELYWSEEGLARLPSSPYPNSSPNNIDVSGNLMTNIEGFSGILQVGGDLDISKSPNLNSIDGLANLSYVGRDLVITDLAKMVNMPGVNRAMFALVVESAAEPHIAI